MRTVFWLCLSLVGYTYFGYALLLSLLRRERPFTKQPYLPTVSIVIAARNERQNLLRKLDNLRALEYPGELVQIIIVSDGSTDGTAEILRDRSDWILPIVLETSGGKARALNEAVQHATGELLVFLDARQAVDPGAIRELASCFADPSIGAVSGELILEDSSGEALDGLGIYWKIEKAVRKLESASGSVVGVTGAIYAIRRELYVNMPPGTILDDVFVPMNVARAGKRVIFEPAAIARDRIFTEHGKEFARKVRTLTGNYQLVRYAPWLLSSANPLLFRFISHKLMRLLAPLLLAVMLIASAAAGGAFYHSLFALQLIFYSAAFVGLWLPSAKAYKPVGIASTFVLLNAAAVVAFYNFITGRNQVWA